MLLLSEQITLLSDQNHFCLDDVPIFTIYFKHCIYIHTLQLVCIAPDGKRCG